MNPALHTPAKIGTPHDPAPPLVVVKGERELADELAAARSNYAAAIRARQEVHTAIERAKLDADASMISRRAAAAYLAGESAADAITSDSAKARGAAAALPELKARLKDALGVEANARDDLRAVLSRIAAHRRDVAAADYARAALALGQAFRELLACDRTATVIGNARPVVPDIVAVPVCAIALDATPKSESSEANGTRWLVSPDGMANHAAAQRRSYEQQQALRELVPAEISWPFDPSSEPPKHLLERYR